MKYFALVIAIITFTTCQPGASGEEENPLPVGKVVVFSNVNVVNMESEIPLMNQDVVIEDDKIFSIVPSSNDQVYDSEKTKDWTFIDGGGMYLVPGLAEMHAHIPDPEQGEPLIEETLFLYLSGGVTTIRGMLGHPRHLELRDQVEDGSILGPRIYTSGPSINGNSAPDIETATGMVREQQAAGYDFLKLHPGLKREVFDAIVSTALEVNIGFAGHVSRDVGIHHAINSDYASIDHLDGYVEGLVPPDESVDPQENGFFGINFTDLADMNLLPELIQQTVAHNVWVVPTQCLAERWAGPVSTDDLLADPEMAYMSPEILKSWEAGKLTMMGDEAYDPEKASRWIDLRRMLIKQMFDGGVGVLLGSDAPQVFNVPGFAILHEIEMYVASGLTPYQALLTGTVNPARYFGEGDIRGKIKEEYQADLILVKGNPLEDISNLRQLEGVMVRGKWLSRLNLDQQLNAVEDNYSQ